MAQAKIIKCFDEKWSKSRKRYVPIVRYQVISPDDGLKYGHPPFTRAEAVNFCKQNRWTGVFIY